MIPKITNILFCFIAYLICTPLFILWLFFCGFLAFLGELLPSKKIAIDLEKVKRKETICSVLNSKKLLSDEEYSFETQDVASLYNELIFRGYLFVLSPIIFLLKHTSFADSFVLYLVHRWMDVHYFNKDSAYTPKTFFSQLFKICVYLAGNVGQVLYRIKP